MKVGIVAEKCHDFLKAYDSYRKMCLWCDSHSQAEQEAHKESIQRTIKATNEAIMELSEALK